MAWSRKALNLISALHSTSGFGVRPAEYSRRKSANTRSLYSAAKLTASSSMPMTSAAAAASTRSSRVEQYSSSSSSSQFFMKRPTTSWPARLSSSAATAESTPPERPTTIFIEMSVRRVKKRKAGPKPRLSRQAGLGYFGAFVSDILFSWPLASIDLSADLSAFVDFLADFLCEDFFLSLVSLLVAAAVSLLAAGASVLADGAAAGAVVPLVVPWASTDTEAEANSTAIRADSFFICIPMVVYGGLSMLRLRWGQPRRLH